MQFDATLHYCSVAGVAVAFRAVLGAGGVCAFIHYHHHTCYSPGGEEGWKGNTAFLYYFNLFSVPMLTQGLILTCFSFRSQYAFFFLKGVNVCNALTGNVHVSLCLVSGTLGPFAVL